MSANPETLRSFETTVEMSMMGEAAKRLNKRTYWGKLLLGRDAATIEVRGDTIVSTFKGDPDHENQLLHMIVDIHRERILEASRPFTSNPDDTFVMAGLWNDTLPFCIEIFEPHIVHVVSSAGAVRSRPYNLRIFPWDTMAMLAEQPAVIKKRDGIGAHFALYTLAEDHVEFGNLVSSGKPGGGGMSGIIWYPDANKHNLPIVICRTDRVPTLAGVPIGTKSCSGDPGSLH